LQFCIPHYTSKNLSGGRQTLLAQYGSVENIFIKLKEMDRKLTKRNFEHKKTCQIKSNSVTMFVNNTYNEIAIIHFVNFRKELPVVVHWAEVEV